MHDEIGVVAVADALYANPNLTFRANLPLLNWGPVNIGSGVFGSSWFTPTQVPGFSTRGQGGVWLWTPLYLLFYPPGLIDLSVRRDPGQSGLSRLPGLGPSVQIEIEQLTETGAVYRGVTLNAVEDGQWVRARGPSIFNPAYSASYTLTLSVGATAAGPGGGGNP